jgi:DNA polymerase-4
LQDIYGIGRRMERRLNNAGIWSVADLWEAPFLKLKKVWGGINGVLFHQMLHGADLQPPSSPFARTLGHQHVLEPELRTVKGARQYAHHLLNRAAERLRHKDYYCRGLSVSVHWMADKGSWQNETSFQETRDTSFLLAQLECLWEKVPALKPLTVGVTLLDLVPAIHHQLDLFGEENTRQERLSPLIDQINRRYGRNTIAFGHVPANVSKFNGHAAFQRVPEAWEF